MMRSPFCNLQFAICNSRVSPSLHPSVSFRGGPAPAPRSCPTLRERRERRRGAVLIMALVCLVLVTVMGGTLLRWAVMEHKLLRSRDEESQARWLAEAGVERAAARLANDPEYTGETWDIAAAELPTAQPARVRMQVTPVDGQPRQRSIEVEVEYPYESGAPARVHKTITYQLPPGEET